MSFIISIDLIFSGVNSVVLTAILVSSVIPTRLIDYIDLRPACCKQKFTTLGPPIGCGVVLSSGFYIQSTASKTGQNNKEQKDQGRRGGGRSAFDYLVVKSKRQLDVINVVERGGKGSVVRFVKKYNRR